MRIGPPAALAAAANEFTGEKLLPQPGPLSAPPRIGNRLAELLVGRMIAIATKH